MDKRHKNIFFEHIGCNIDDMLKGYVVLCCYFVIHNFVKRNSLYRSVATCITRLCKFESLAKMSSLWCEKLDVSIVYCIPWTSKSYVRSQIDRAFEALWAGTATMWYHCRKWIIPASDNIHILCEIKLRSSTEKWFGIRLCRQLDHPCPLMPCDTKCLGQWYPVAFTTLHIPVIFKSFTKWCL